MPTISNKQDYLKDLISIICYLPRTKSDLPDSGFGIFLGTQYVSTYDLGQRPLIFRYIGSVFSHGQ